MSREARLSDESGRHFILNDNMMKQGIYSVLAMTQGVVFAVHSGKFHTRQGGISYFITKISSEARGVIILLLQRVRLVFE